MEFTHRAKGLFGVTLIAVSVFLVVSFSTYSTRDWPFAAGASLRDVGNLTGPFGSLLSWVSFELFGRLFAWLVPAVLLAMAINSRGTMPVVRRWIYKAVTIVVLLNAFFALTPLASNVTTLHGRLGDGIASALELVFGEIGSTIIIVAAILLIALGEIGHLLRGTAGLLGRMVGGGGVKRPIAAVVGGVRSRMGDYFAELGDHAHRLGGEEDERASSASAAPEWREPAFERHSPVAVVSDEVKINHAETGRRRPGPGGAKLRKPGETLRPLSRASLPPLSMLKTEGPEIHTYSREELRNWSSVLEEKLANYGVEGKVTAVHHGPVVTTFEFEPAPGVRIKDIVSRADDLALAMRARSLRMIAPIPGRAAVGIEIPNPEARTVLLHDVLSEIPENLRVKGIMVGLGVDVVGRPFVMNLCDAPHLLIAGTTGSGKSVCINTILSSILFQYRPDHVRLLLVDPKIVEMDVYNGVPHLLHPVITDPKEAAKALEYLVAEMSRRNRMFREHSVRNIESYNALVALGKTVVADGEPMQRLPYIVVVIDEMGDLALAKGYDIETLLARLAQMARAAGIHMVLATQRPSVDVIVGKTKANFPTRIAFRVATKVDSRTIIDTMGADKLLGKGDMLYLDAQHPQPVRLHGAWIGEDEIDQLIGHWKSYEFDEESLELTAGHAGSAEMGENVDPLFHDARSVVFQYKQGSTSLLQRKLRIGYARAARLLDQLEEAGIVGPPAGSKPRQVYTDDLSEDRP